MVEVTTQECISVPLPEWNAMQAERERFLAIAADAVLDGFTISELRGALQNMLTVFGNDVFTGDGAEGDAIIGARRVLGITQPKTG